MKTRPNLPPHSRKTLRLLSSRQSDLEQASMLLKSDRIVALPTETVYGLAGNGLSKNAIQNVFFAKNRPPKNPLILHVDEEDKARALFRFNSALVNERFLRLSRNFWPGPLTIIAEKAPHIPAIATANLSTCAVRIPDNLATRTIMKRLDFPLVMPSANLSGRPSPTSALHVLHTLDGRIDAVVDDGKSKIGIESTVVRIDSLRPIMLRPGMVTKLELEDVLKEMVEDSAEKNPEEPLSPGQSFLHYSPRMASVKLVSLDSASDHWQSEDIFLATTSDFSILKNHHKDRPSGSINFLLSNEANSYAANLYEALYKCEHYAHKSLVIVMPSLSTKIKWRAICDRLSRSAGHLGI